MITFKDFLIESRSAPLYHATTLINGTRILKSDKIVANPTHESWLNRRYAKKAISLTRSYRFATSWRDTGDINTYENVIIELDQRKLTQRYRISPIDIEYMWHRDETPHKQYTKRSPSLDEEFVMQDIAPLSKYLAALHISSKTWEDTEHRKKMIKWFGGGVKEYDRIFKNKLLKVNGKFVNQ